MSPMMEADTVMLENRAPSRKESSPSQHMQEGVYYADKQEGFSRQQEHFCKVPEIWKKYNISLKW